MAPSDIKLSESLLQRPRLVHSLALHLSITRVAVCLSCFDFLSLFRLLLVFRRDSCMSVFYLLFLANFQKQTNGILKL